MSRPGWLTVALGCAAGFFIGVVLVVGLGGPSNDPEARTRPAPAGPRVPAVVGQALDAARARLESAGYALEVASGGGLFGPVIESNWAVADQEPRAGAPLNRGATVKVALARR
jgi:PASTA domain